MIIRIAPTIVIPLVGHAISGGDGDIAFGLLAIFVVLATLANLRPTGIPLVGNDSGHD